MKGLIKVLSLKKSVRNLLNLNVSFNFDRKEFLCFRRNTDEFSNKKMICSSNFGNLEDIHSPLREKASRLCTSISTFLGYRFRESAF